MNEDEYEPYHYVDPEDWLPEHEEDVLINLEER